MLKIYFLIFDSSSVNREQLIAFMEANDKVADYHTSVPQNLIVVVSALTAQELAELFKGAGGLARYAFTRIDPQKLGVDTFGWMSPALWEFVARHAMTAPVAPPVTASPSTESAKA